MGLALDEPLNTDIQVTVEAIDFVYSQKDQDYIQNSLIDFKKTMFGDSFSVTGSDYGPC